MFVQMPEGTVNGPIGTLGPFRPGAGLIALRVGGPIVPLAIAGTEELYVGRRMASRILPATTIEELLGSGWDGPAGARQSRGARPRAADHRGAGRPPSARSSRSCTRGRWTRRRILAGFRRRLTWLLLGPGRQLEH